MSSFEGFDGGDEVAAGGLDCVPDVDDTRDGCIHDLVFEDFGFGDVFFSGVAGDSAVTDCGGYLFEPFVADVTGGKYTGDVGFHFFVGVDVAGGAHVDDTFEDLGVGDVADEEEAGVYGDVDDLVGLEIFEGYAAEVFFIASELGWKGVPDEFHFGV